MPHSRGWMADATVLASERAFSFVQDDRGYREAVWLLTQLGIAAKKPDARGHLAAVGIKLSANASLAEVPVAVGSMAGQAAAWVIRSRARSQRSALAR